MIRTEDIEAEIQAVRNEIQAVKAANVNWITDPVVMALITSLNSNLAELRSEYGRSRAFGDTFFLITIYFW
jgi:hypothetical protein